MSEHLQQLVAVYAPWMLSVSVLINAAILLWVPAYGSARYRRGIEWARNRGDS